MGMITWGTGCHQEPRWTRVVGVREGLQDGTTEDGITEVLPVAGTKLGVLWQNGIIVEVLLEVGIIVEALQEVGITEEVLQGGGIIVEVLLVVGITEEVLLGVGITEGGLLGVGITEGVLLEVLIVEGAPLEAGRTEEEPGVVEEVLPVVGIVEDIPPEDGIIEELLAVGTIVEVLVGVALEVAGGMKGDPLQEEDGTREEIEEDGRPVGVGPDGKTEDQTGVLPAIEVRDGSPVVAGGCRMAQTGAGIAVAEEGRRTAGVMIRATHQDGTTAEETEEGIGVVGVAETGGGILLLRAQEAGGIEAGRETSITRNTTTTEVALVTTALTDTHRLGLVGVADRQGTEVLRPTCLTSTTATDPVRAVSMTRAGQATRLATGCQQ